MQTYSPVKVAQQLLRLKLKTAQCIIDATVGNGNDTLFLAQYSPNYAQVLAMDIQEVAITAAKALLAEHGLLAKVAFVLDSHEKIGQYIKGPIDIVMYNLGYLPGGNRLLSTRVTSTMAAVNYSVNHLAVGGVISITTYPGHEQGELEYQALADYLQGLSAKLYTIGRWELVNHSNRAPVLYIIEKTRE